MTRAQLKQKFHDTFDAHMAFQKALIELTGLDYIGDIRPTVQKCTEVADTLLEVQRQAEMVAIRQVAR